MMSGSSKNLFISALVGAALSYGANYFISGESDQSQKIISMENKIKNLEMLLAKAEDNLKNPQMLSLQKNATNNQAAVNKVNEIHKQVGESEQVNAGHAVADASPNHVQVLRNLVTSSDNDPRSVSEKVNDLVSSSPTKENIAIASKAIFDLAKNSESLPDYALQSMYSHQTDPDLKRVIAQVLSQRNNNTLIDNQVAEAQTELKSQNPADRQAALNNLAKMHSANAANVIVPLLHDPDINVKLDALLALRATGNQTHVSLAENLLNDPDPAVSSLANDVVSSLKNLSESARTTLSLADIAAELPVMETP